MTTTRLITTGDAAELTALLLANREFLAPWEPVRSDEFFTEENQRAIIEGDLGAHEQGTKLPHVILDDDGRLIGRITLNGIVQAPSFRSCSMGYWVGADANGRGHATAAVREIVRVAFTELGLHRVQAEILLHNAGSQRVLERNGFERYGMAPAYLRIAGRWQDHAMYQLLNPAA